ncbi:MAG: hypothetical protein HQL57_05035 [Magnetococcales bacterium]|nr:hypothetical protein [Magnetococcales bacterium]MBF0156529.1 hypothetical protein [Magnetococcales bacterium]
MLNDDQATATRKQLEYVLRKLLPLRLEVRAIRERHRKEEEELQERQKAELAPARNAAIATEKYLEVLLEAMQEAESNTERTDLQKLSDKMKKRAKKHEKALREWAEAGKKSS